MNTILFPQLQAFLAVARSQSFTAAARELGVSRSAVSQSVRQLEEELRVTLVTRTTRSVSLTDAGKRLVLSAAPAVAQVRAALTEVTAKPGEVIGRLRLTVPRAGFEFVIQPFLPRFRARHPRIELELVFEDRRVDIVREGFDAGIRLSEFVERDMISLRLTGPLRFLVVGAPSYLKRHGTPERPEDLLQHECLTFRSETTGSLYAWELERGRKTWRVPVHGTIVTNNGHLCLEWAAQGLGLSYAFEALAKEHLRSGHLVGVLEPYASTVSGFYLYYPSRSQRSPALRLFVEAIREFAAEQLPAGSPAKRTSRRGGTPSQSVRAIVKRRLTAHAPART